MYKAVKSSLLSLGLVAALGTPAVAASRADAKDALGGKTFCEFQSNYYRSLREAPVPLSQDKLELVEAEFAATHLADLRSGKLERPSVARLPVALESQGEEVLVYSPGAGRLVVSSNQKGVLNHVALDRVSQRGVRLDLQGEGHLVVHESVSQAGLEELYVFLHGGKTSIEMQAMVPCALVDGSQAEGPLYFDASQAVPPKAEDGVEVQCGFTTYGTAGADYMTGSACKDIFYGNGGRDQLFGLDGNDYLNGGGDYDLVYGNTGSDCLIAGSGAYDELYGGQNDDILSVGNSTAYCHGDLGYDRCGASPGCSTRILCETTAGAFCGP
jgi:hypothetical protein